MTRVSSENSDCVELVEPFHCLESRILELFIEEEEDVSRFTHGASNAL